VDSPFASHRTPAGQRINWAKHATFVVLVVCGLIFWVPALLRATVGDTQATAAALDDAARSRDRSATADATEASAKPGGLLSETVLCVERPRSAADCLVLTSTILGKSRRAAIVNGRLHRQGDRILAAGELFQLTRVADDRIELSREVGNAGGAAAGDRQLTIRLSSSQHGTTR
jgi:hypothetical protein